MNLSEKYFVVNQTSYSNIYLPDEDLTTRIDTSKFWNVTFEVTYSKKIYNNKTPYNLCSSYLSEYSGYTCSVTNSTLPSGDTLNLVQLRKDYVISIDNTIGYVDGLVKYVYFDNFEVPDNFNDYAFKIKEIGFYPYITGLGELNNYHFCQNYENVNYQKYTMSVDKTMNVFYSNITYSRFNHEFNVELGLGTFSGLRWDGFEDFVAELLGLKYVYIYQFFNFNFYFDEERTLTIPNVKKISFMYQKGYKYSNENDTYGFYYNDLENFPINTLTINVGEKLENGTFDNFSLEKINYSENSLVDEKYRYDYSIINYYDSQNLTNFENNINGLSPLEIYYETAEYETIKLVGNSLGLHVVYDEFGNALVYDGDGNLQSDYDVFIDDDGYVFPTLDLNSDGNITSNEIVNSDTGICDYRNEVSKEKENAIDGIKDYINGIIDNIKDYFNNLFSGYKDKFSALGQALTLIFGMLGCIVLYIYVINPIIKLFIMFFKSFRKKE